MPELLAPETVMTWGPRRLPVPYVAHWSAECSYGQRVTMRPDAGGIWYLDESPADRDAFDMLWGRMGEAPGEGRPNLGAVHPVRQRRAQAERLCQVCGRTASHTRDGWLFLMNHDGSNDYEGATKPPVCLHCAALATRHCPHLTRPVAVRSRRPKIWGVFGTLYTPTPGTSRLTAHVDEYLPYGHRASNWFRASQLVVALKRCTVVNLDAELAALIG
ncbi:hypothetical protein SAMN06297387_13616 [Streptomyces zhaozhouensis]|uniref:Uncharacterized protein n=1 Tax=Streptomyces zhaozhouensis TaxID=1300267 RepID=A0A286EAA8_9ACTN|nr:hypothetical protein [Streptomyces zhaozhouensis]SOD67842.1 hypothetical protein SAMN06297387_13616 [Streptomyces zhaozhouensis]